MKLEIGVEDPPFAETSDAKGWGTQIRLGGLRLGHPATARSRSNANAQSEGERAYHPTSGVRESERR